MTGPHITIEIKDSGVTISVSFFHWHTSQAIILHGVESESWQSRERKMFPNFPVINLTFDSLSENHLRFNVLLTRNFRPTTL